MSSPADPIACAMRFNYVNCVLPRTGYRIGEDHATRVLWAVETYPRLMITEAIARLEAAGRHKLTASPPPAPQRLGRRGPLAWLTKKLRNRHFKHPCETIEHVYDRIFI